MKLRGMFASLFREKKPTREDSIRGSLIRLFESDRFPEIISINPGRVYMDWPGELLVIATDGRWPNVTVNSKACSASYDYDQILVDKAFSFARRADAARDLSVLADSLNKILQ